MAIIYVKDSSAESAIANLKFYTERGEGAKISLGQNSSIIINNTTENIVNYAVVYRKYNYVNYYIYNGIEYLSNIQENNINMLYISKKDGNYLYFFEDENLKFFPEELIDSSSRYDFANIYIRTPSYHLIINVDYLNNNKAHVTSRVTEDIDGLFYKQLIDNMINLAILPQSIQRNETMRIITKTY